MKGVSAMLNHDNCTSANFKSKTRKTALEIMDVFDDMHKYLPLTVRQVFYQLVSKLLIKNSLKEYGRVSRILGTLREVDAVPWEYVTDRTRKTTGKRGVRNVAEWLESKLFFLKPDYYGRCYIQNQDVYLEVATEKDALSSILENTIYPYCTRLNIVRGQVSKTMVKNIADRYAENAMKGNELVLLYLGDLDPTGIAIPKALVRNMYDLHGVKVELVRVALNPEQVESHNLPVSLDAIKDKDPNYGAWLKAYGKKQPAVELDALHPSLLERLTVEAIESIYDMSEFSEQIEQEREDRQLINKIRLSIENHVSVNFPEVYA